MIKLLFSILLEASLLFPQTNFENLQNQIAGLDDSLKVKELYDFAVVNKYNDPHAALLGCNEAVKIARSGENKIKLAELLNLSGAVNIELDELETAFSLIENARQIAESTKNGKLQNECYKNSVKYYEVKKDFRNAFVYLKKYETLKDSLSKKSQAEKISKLETELKSLKTEKEENSFYSSANIEDAQRYFLIGVIIFALIAASIIYKMYQNKKADSEKLGKINKMKDTLIRLIAHDLKTPFTVIFGYTDVLREDFHSISDDEKLAYLDRIRRASHLSVQLLENLTMWSKSYADKLEFNLANINLGDIVKENIYLLEPSATEKKIKLSSDIGENVIAYADENMIKTVLRNLFSNAIKFTNEDGFVKIKCARSGKMLKVIVEDNGIGIDDFVKTSLFNLDEFVSSEGTAGERGSGFGLVLCKEFVEKNGGKIWVESEVGKGSKFVFTVPMGR